MPIPCVNGLPLLFLFTLFFFKLAPSNGLHLNYGEYYSVGGEYPLNFNGAERKSVYPYSPHRVRAAYAYPQAIDAPVGSLQPLDRPPYGTVYWPPAMLNAQGQTTGDMTDNGSGGGQPIQPQYGGQIPADFINGLTWALINAITSALFPRQAQQPTNTYGLPNPQPAGSNLPFVNLVPSAGIHLGPSQQYGYGSNMGVYAGIQSQQTGYNYNYNTNGQAQGQIYGQQQVYGRPYGTGNSNVGGSYGGLSQWPFVQPVPKQGSSPSSTNQVTSSTMARPRPTQPSSTTTANGPQSNEFTSVGTVRALSLQDLVEARKKRSVK